MHILKSLRVLRVLLPLLHVVLVSLSVLVWICFSLWFSIRASLVSGLLWDVLKLVVFLWRSSSEVGLDPNPPTEWLRGHIIWSVCVIAFFFSLYALAPSLHTLRVLDMLPLAGTTPQSPA